MNILFLAWEFFPKMAGGLGVACYHLHRSLEMGRNIGLRLVLPEIDREGLYGNGYGGASLLRLTRAYADKCATAADSSIDVAYAHDWPTFPAALALLEQRGLPFVAHIHSLGKV